MGYIHVKINNQPLAEKIKAHSDKQHALIAATGDKIKEKLEADMVFTSTRNSHVDFYLAYKAKPENPWYRKNDVTLHEGYYLLVPKVKTDQDNILRKIVDEFEQSVKEQLVSIKTHRSMIVEEYPELDVQAAWDNPFGPGINIAESAFAVTSECVILGKIPFNDNVPELQEYAEELTVSQFTDLLNQHKGKVNA